MNPAAAPLGTLEALARRDSPLHRLDARAKLLATLLFLIVLLAQERHAVGGLLPFAAYPLLLWALSGLPAAPLLRRLALVAPFALLVGAFNPLIERETLLLGGIEIGAGWLSFASIALRALLAIGTLLLLVATSGVPALVRAAGALGVPRPLTQQLLLLHRYLFLLAAEGRTLLQAHALRAAAPRPSWNMAGNLIGQLLLRALARAQRLHQAMRCRGFDGRMPLLRPQRFGAAEWRFLLLSAALVALLGWGQPAQRLGALLTGDGA